jgi:hypothetical protein
LILISTALNKTLYFSSIRQKALFGAKMRQMTPFGAMWAPFSAMKSPFCVFGAFLRFWDKLSFSAVCVDFYCLFPMNNSQK